MDHHWMFKQRSKFRYRTEYSNVTQLPLTVSLLIIKHKMLHYSETYLAEITEGSTMENKQTKQLDILCFLM